MKERLRSILLRRKYSKLQYVIPILLIILSLTGILAAMILNTGGLHKKIGENTKHYADDVSAQMASNISSRMRMRETHIKNLADSFSNMPEFVLSEDLLDRKVDYLEMEDMLVINEDGSIFPEDKDYPGLIEYVKSHPKTYSQASIFFISNDEIFYSAPIIREGGTNSLLVGVCTKNTLQKTLQEVDFKEQGMCCIVDSTGKVIVPATDQSTFLKLEDIFDGDMSGKDGIEAKRVLNDIENRKSGMAQFDSIGELPIMMGYDFLEINDWMLLSLVSFDVVNRGTNSLMNRYMMIVESIAILLILILIYIVWFYQKSLKQINELALTDPLTNGHSFLSFQLEGSNILHQYPQRDYAIIYLNIRSFKWFNERYGVKYGDQVLKAVHKNLNDCLDEDELMARFMGDQFYLMIHAANEESVRSRLDNILNYLTEQLLDSFALSRINFQQGACLIREQDAEFIVLADRAKTACARGQGDEECYFYDESLRARVQRERGLEEHFNDAIKNREFQLYIQPKVCTQSKTPCGGEVLVRWKHPEYGFVSPGEFIPVFERSGLVRALDFYMFEETCRLLQSWLEKGRQMSLSVNLSRAHLISRDLSFLDKFKTIKQQYQIPDDMIELELTESLMMERQDIRLVMKMIDKIREYGFLCSIDDFGFGHSSLSLLKDLNVNTVKLDRQFFNDESEKSWMVVSQLISLTHDLNMTVVAEGIETDDQVKKLSQCSCDMIQGYVFSKPIPGAEFLNWSEAFYK